MAGEHKLSKEQIDLLSLNTIISGHQKQALAMPTIMVRSMELNHDTNVREIEKQAHDLYESIMTETIVGHDLQTCLLTIAFLHAELYTQASMVTQAAQANSPTDSDLDSLYG